MFLVEVLTIAEKALQAVFVPGYTTSDAQTDFSNLHISIEYPISPQNYPGVWVDFDVDGQLTRSGIDSIFNYTQIGSNFVPFYLWRAQGWLTYTVVALTSLQRARLHDELVRVFAFNGESSVEPYRQTIENNPLIAMNVNFDNIAERSAAATPGTPWGTDEIIYEQTLALQCVIEFISTNNADELMPFGEIDVIASDPVGNQRTWQDVNGVQSAGT